jgi:hypothetical protein
MCEAATQDITRNQGGQCSVARGRTPPRSFLASAMKERIYYHRAYKTLAGPRRASILVLCLLAGGLSLAILLLHQEILQRFVWVAGEALHRCGVQAEVRAWPFLPPLVEDLPILDAVCVFPSRQLALAHFLVSLLVVLGAPQLRRLPRALTVYVVFLALLNAASAAFLLLAPQLYPYDIADFSLLYLGIELGIWVLTPLLLAWVLGPLPGAAVLKILLAAATAAYAMLFGAVRYAAFLYLLNELTILPMAALFFALGPLVDFVYLVAIYSLYVNLVALRLRSHPEAWRWLFSS